MKISQQIEDNYPSTNAPTRMQQQSNQISVPTINANQAPGNIIAKSSMTTQNIRSTNIEGYSDDDFEH